MEIPIRKPNRLIEYRYNAANAYYITICTAFRRELFWECANQNITTPEDVVLSNYGAIVKKAIQDISRHYPMVSVDCYTIMPNHVHLLLQIETTADGQPIAAPTVSNVIQKMKGAVSRQAGFSVWQKSFYDHVVRNESDYLEIWNYIYGNPMKWINDPHYIR